MSRSEAERHPGSDSSRHVKDVVGSSVASFLATAVDGLLFAALTMWVFDGSGRSVGGAAAIGAVAGGGVHYSLSRFWVFRRFGASLLRSAVIYFAMSWAAAAAHGLLTGWMSGRFGAGIAWFISKGLVWALWTYPMSRYVVFGGVGASEGDEGRGDAADGGEAQTVTRESRDEKREGVVRCEERGWSRAEEGCE